MGLGNSFQNIEDNLQKLKEDHEKKYLQYYKDNPVIVEQSDNIFERFSSIDHAQKYLEDIIPIEFEVYIDNEDNQESFEMVVQVKLIKRSK